MKNDKSPGCDGFTTNFYKVLWRKIGHFVVRALNFSCNSNEFSRNIKLVLITRIPKDNKLDADYVVKWFVQISLWLKSALNHLISAVKTGILKDRYIGKTNRLVFDIMQCCEVDNIPGM